MSDDRVVSDLKSDGVSMWYWLLPLLLGIILTVFFIVHNLTSGRDFFDSWGYWVLCFVVPGVLSLIIYLLVELSRKKPQGIEYNGRDFCDSKIVREFNLKHGVNVEKFSSIAFSQSYIQFFGKDGSQKVKVYVSTWRDITPYGGYYLVLMNMEKGKEDDICHEKLPANLTKKNVFDLIDLLGNRMATEQTVVRPNIVQQYDPLSNRTITNIKYDNLSQANIPDDVDID